MRTAKIGPDLRLLGRRRRRLCCQEILNSATTANTTSCVATKYSNIFKRDYILFILTRNQLSSVVREGTEAGATVINKE